MKTRLVFAYYILKDQLDSIIYKYHLECINQDIEIFDYIDFYLCIDNVNDYETIEYVKQFISNNLFTNTNINFIVVQNNTYYREGNIYYNQLILRLQEYAANNELVLFSHTKGLTNDDIENSKTWICLIYYYCLHQFWYAKYCMTEPTINKISYGPLYHYSLRNLSKYKWMYVGGVSWLNTKHFNDYIKENNLELFNHSRDINIRTCAEEYLPNMLDVNNVSFYEFENYNLYNDVVKYENHTLCYSQILYFASKRMSPNIYYDFINYKEKIDNIINQ